MKITGIDHIVMTVSDIPRALAFYAGVLGMREVVFGDNRRALAFGSQKINLHQQGREFSPRAKHAGTGTVDLCLLTDTPLEEVVAELTASSVEIEEGIVARTGALGAISSVYIRDPGGNLIEISRYGVP